MLLGLTGGEDASMPLIGLASEDDEILTSDVEDRQALVEAAGIPIDLIPV